MSKELRKPALKDSLKGGKHDDIITDLYKHIDMLNEYIDQIEDNIDKQIEVQYKLAKQIVELERKLKEATDYIEDRETNF